MTIFFYIRSNTTQYLTTHTQTITRKLSSKENIWLDFSKEATESNDTIGLV